MKWINDLGKLPRIELIYCGDIAELSAQVRDYHNEMKFVSHQIDKLRDAILQIAQETGILNLTSRYKEHNCFGWV